MYTPICISEFDLFDEMGAILFPNLRITGEPKNISISASRDHQILAINYTENNLETK